MNHEGPLVVQSTDVSSSSTQHTSIRKTSAVSIRSKIPSSSSSALCRMRSKSSIGLAVLTICCCYAPFLVHGFGLNQNRILLPIGSRINPSPLYALKSLDNAAVSNENNNPGKEGGGSKGPQQQQSFSKPTTTSASITNNSDELLPLPAPTKLARLKDLMWVREAQEDVTAAEFACSVETQQQQQRRGRRAVDYEKLLIKLNQRLLDLGCSPQPPPSSTLEDDESATKETEEEEKEPNSKTPSWLLLGGKFRKRDAPPAPGTTVEPVVVRDNDFVCWLDPNQGMGRFTYTEEQRVALLQRIVRTRNQLMQVLEGNQKSANDDSASPSSIVDANFKFPELPELPKLPKEDNADAVGPKLYVRDDGTVDWDGALQDQAALREFGTAVWARINGRALLEEGDPSAPPTANIPTTAAIEQTRAELDHLRAALVQMEQSHIQLLNSAITQGQATANIKLAAIEPQLRSQIQESAATLDLLKLKVSFQTLVYEMERIFTYLLGELGNPAMKGYIPLQDRLNVAEFGLLESQMESFRVQFMNGGSDAAMDQQPIAVDEDVLAVVLEQLVDFKRRLGIDYYVTGLSLDREAIARWVSELWMKTKSGIAFYVKGVQLFWNDIVFCLRLVNRAAQGYTLKPREVRTIRRTFKDIITFIPFMIILIIPLTPIGHVLVFGAIQRFFPDFFPSCFTEQRQNLLQLYETAEYSELTIQETLGKKMSRLFTATIYLLVNSLRKAYFQLVGTYKKQDDEQQ